MNAIEKDAAKSETKLEVLEQSFIHAHRHLDRIDKRFDAGEKRLLGIETNLSMLRSQLNDEFKELRVDLTDKFIDIRREMASQQKWILGVMITLFSGIYATLFSQLLEKFMH